MANATLVGSGTASHARPVTFFPDVRYGIAAGVLAASAYGAIDAVGSSLLGNGVVAVIPVSITIGYLAFGVVTGAMAAVVAAVVTPGSEAGVAVGERMRQIIRTAQVALWIGISGWIFATRIRDGNGAVIDVEVATLVPAFLLLIAAFFGLGWIGHQPRRAGDVLIQVGIIGAATMCWSPFNDLYHASLMSVMSIAANSVFLGLMLGAYFLCRWLADKFQVLAIENGRAIGITSALVIVVGSSFALGASALKVRGPIDLPYAPGIAPEEANDRPDVILIVLDTVRADHMSGYGYPRSTTPHIDAFAKQAVVYTNAVSTSSWTLPAHASLFTGMLPTEHGAHLHEGIGGREVRGLSDDHLVLAEVLLSHGYATGAVIGNTAALTRDMGFDQGFLYFDDRERATVATADLPSMAPSRLFTLSWQRAKQDDRRFHYGGHEFRYCWRFADALTDSAVDWLKRDVDAPRFLFINYMDPHDPYRWHGEFAEQLGIAHARTLKDELVADLDRYDSEIASVDVQVNRLFEALKRVGRYEDSLIIVTSDHGEAFGEHGCYGHSNTLYQEEIHIPLIVRFPQARQFGVCEDRISIADIAEMVFEELDVAKPEAMTASRDAREGRQLAELRPGKDCHDEPQRDWTVRATISSSGIKMIDSAQADGTCEVYDLSTDPLEVHDLSGDDADALTAMQHWLLQWTEEAHVRRQLHRDASPVDEDVRRRLAALGYLD